MNFNCNRRQTDFGPNPYVANIQQMSIANNNFRTAVWTGCDFQMTHMCIPPCQDIGAEVHPDTEQLIRVEQGNAMAIMGECEDRMDYQQCMNVGDAVFVPAGIWHNVVNTGRQPLKLSSIYSPPHHPHGTIHRTKADAEREEY